MHAAPCGQTGSNIDNSYGSQHLFDDQRCLDRMKQIWRRIAKHYENSSAVIGYELLNEPMPYIEAKDPKHEALNKVYRDVSIAIKEVDTKHLIFLDGANWAGSFQNFDSPAPFEGAYTFFIAIGRSDRSGISSISGFSGAVDRSCLHGRVGREH